MKKVVDILLWIFGIGMALCLIAGGLAVVGFIVALFVGGDLAAEMCFFIHKTYFPYVIQFTSVFVGVGLLGMYLGRLKALSLKADGNQKSDETQE